MNTSLPELHAKGFGDVLGTSLPMLSMFELLRRGAPTDATVLITGESGTGKEILAQTVHALSSRADKPMISVNCASIPATLIEAELFGYEKGSFTGASRAHAGVFERANGGTLFLDEITEMPLEMQTRLLRVLETSSFYRVGGNQEVSIDVRLIAATNRDPGRAVREGQLRSDVMYRLAVYPIAVPPLRDRGDDRMLLATHFLDQLNADAGTHKRLSANTIEAVHEYEWPGNVRELRNTIERAFILADEFLEVAPLLAKHAQDGEDGAGETANGVYVPLGASLDEAERSLIEATLHHFEGNKRRAAEVLGCSLKTLYNKLHRYNGTRPSSPQTHHYMPRAREHSHFREAP